MVKRMIRLLPLAFLPVVFNGCSTPTPTPQQMQAGAIWMFPGIFGGDWSLAEARRGFRDAGVQQAIYCFDWQRPGLMDPFPNLMDEAGNRERAARCAQEITAYAQAYPGRPICLVGYSGGAGVALMVAEALAPKVRLQNVLLVHGAVSPDYNLACVLERVDGKLVNFYSSLDWFMLGLGTTVFGTIDRQYTAAAGKVGFDLEQAVPNLSDRHKIVQVAWDIGQCKNWHFGNHLNMIVCDWNKNRVAPYLQDRQISVP